MEQKITWMKHLIIGSLFSVFLLSCKKENNDNLVFEDINYTNLSSHNIEIFAYKNSDVTTYAIANNSSIFQQQELLFGSVDSLVVNADSIKIVFDNIKILKFHQGSNSSFNILDKNNYNQNTIGNKHFYDYTFTVADYNEAQ